MTQHKFSNFFHKGTQTKSQVPANHQLILENLLQVPAPHHFLIINLLSPLEKNIYQSEKFEIINPKDLIIFPGQKGISCWKKKRNKFFYKTIYKRLIN